MRLSSHPSACRILADAYPPERRTAAIGIWAAAAGLGFGAGPVVGGILVELFSWSAVFWVNVPIGIIGLVLVSTGVRESRNPDARGLDLPGAVLVAAGLCVLTFAIIESEHFGWTSPTMIALLATATVLLISFVVVESKVREPMVPLGLFRIPGSLFPAGSTGHVPGAGFDFLLRHAVLPERRGVVGVDVALYSVMNTPFLIASMFAGRLAVWIGTATCWLGVLLGGLGVLALAFLTPGAGLLAASPGYVLIGAGYGWRCRGLSRPVTLPLEHSGLASGALNSARQVGTAVGLAALGSVGLAGHPQLLGSPNRPTADISSSECPGHRPGRERGQGSVVAQQLGPAAARGYRLRRRPARGAADRRRAHAGRRRIRLRRAPPTCSDRIDRRQRCTGARGHRRRRLVRRRLVRRWL